MKFIALFISLFLTFLVGAQELPKLTIQEKLQIEQVFSLAALQTLLVKKDKIIGIELVIADAGEGTGSQWGHTLLHLVDKDLSK